MAVAAMAATAIIVGAPAAGAHPRLLSADPKPSTVAPGPIDHVTVHFDEAVQWQYSQIGVEDTQGHSLLAGKPQVANREAILPLVPGAGGALRVSWRLVGVNTHPVIGATSSGSEGPPARRPGPSRHRHPPDGRHPRRGPHRLRGPQLGHPAPAPETRADRSHLEFAAKASAPRGAFALWGVLERLSDFRGGPRQLIKARPGVGECRRWSIPPRLQIFLSRAIGGDSTPPALSISTPSVSASPGKNRAFRILSFGTASRPARNVSRWPARLPLSTVET